MRKSNELNVKGTSVRVMRVGEEDFICLTDMAAGRGDSVRAADVIKNWLRARYTLEFLGTWEQLHNPDFKVVEFDHFKAQAGLPNFVLSVSEWIASTNMVHQRPTSSTDTLSLKKRREKLSIGCATHTSSFILHTCSRWLAGGENGKIHGKMRKGGCYGGMEDERGE